MSGIGHLRFSRYHAVLVVVMVSAAAACGSDDGQGSAEGEVGLTIGGSGTGGGGFIAGGTMAEWVNNLEGLEHLSMTNQATAGGPENLRLVASGELDLGLTPSNFITLAMQGEDPFEGEAGFEDVQAVFPVWSQYGIIATFDDGIADVADLGGGTVNVGTGGSSSFTMAQGVLEAAGVLDSVQQDQQDWSEGVRLMQDGLVDAFFIMGPAPFPAVDEAAASPGRDLRFIDTSDVVDDVLALRPDLVEITMAEGTFGAGLPDVSMETVGSILYVSTNAAVSEEAIFDLMNAVLSDEGREYLDSGYAGYDFELVPGFETLVDMNAAGTPLKLHPGAVRYYEEQGLEVPDEIRP